MTKYEITVKARGGGKTLTAKGLCAKRFALLLEAQREYVRVCEFAAAHYEAEAANGKHANYGNLPRLLDTARCILFRQRAKLNELENEHNAR